MSYCPLLLTTIIITLLKLTTPSINFQQPQLYYISNLPYKSYSIAHDQLFPSQQLSNFLIQNPIQTKAFRKFPELQQQYETYTIINVPRANWYFIGTISLLITIFVFISTRIQKTEFIRLKNEEEDSLRIGECEDGHEVSVEQKTETEARSENV